MVTHSTLLHAIKMCTTQRLGPHLQFNKIVDDEGITNIQGLPERVLKVNPFARALIFTKNGFSGVFWDEK